MSRRMHIACGVVLVACAGFVGRPAAALGQSFVNWESPHVHPLDLTPDGARLLALNTADNRLEVYDVSGGTLTHLVSIPVGLDPVSVRAHGNAEAWVVNHVSDTISIVDLTTYNVRRTIDTGDEPADVVFAGTPERAFVSLSQLNQVRVLDPANLAAPPVILNIQGEDPRALAVDAAGSRVFVGIFESGNKSTILQTQQVSAPGGPYGGQNPPPNVGNAFVPPITPGLPPPPPVNLIVRADAGGQWFDDNQRNWSSFITWNLHDHDVAIIDTASLNVTYASGLMTTIMSLAVAPSGDVTVVGTEATNQIRFEPILNGVFLRVQMATFPAGSPTSITTVDLNPHLTYTAPSVPQNIRDQSLGDPRAIVWHPDGTRAYVAGMGSNSVVVVDPDGARLAQINVADGPTGLALSADGTTLYVLSRFGGRVEKIDTATNTLALETHFFDPTPAAIKTGRPFLYASHLTSGLGHVSCASCHIDGRTDHLAWDLGNPAGQMDPFANANCRPNQVCEPWHPMKGPMVTQTLQGIVGNEPFHWRGDRANLAAFSGAFTGLQGDDAPPSPAEMQQFTDFVATIQYPPNPNRNLDNSLPTAFPTTTGMGNAANGANLFATAPIFGGLQLTCTACHALPSGSDRTIDSPPGLVQQMKIAQMRNMHEKTGFSRGSQNNNRGFGFNHDSQFDTLFNIMNAPGFNFPPGPPGQQQRRDLEAYMLCFSTDFHAAVGRQITFDGSNNSDPAALATLTMFEQLASVGTLGLIAKSAGTGTQRGFAYVTGIMQSDRLAEATSIMALRLSAGPSAEMTFTLVPAGSQIRMGIDRDADGIYDRDEIDACSNPSDPRSRPGVPSADITADGLVNAADVTAFVDALLGLNPDPQQVSRSDLNCDAARDGRDVSPFAMAYLAG